MHKPITGTRQHPRSPTTVHGLVKVGVIVRVRVHVNLNLSFTVGCAPIPEDYTNYWAPNYTQRSMGLASKGVPITADADLVTKFEVKNFI